MKIVSRLCLNSALIVSSMASVGCVLMPPLLLTQQTGDRSEMKMSSARLEESRGNLDAAKRLYTEVHQKNPGNAESLHRLAVISTEEKRLDEAEAYYRKAYSLDPKNPLLLADMGYTAFLRNDFGQAEMFFEKSVSLNGQDRVVVANLAIARAWMEKDAESLATFRMIYGEVESLRRLAAIQDSRGDHERCQKNLELAGRLNSSVLTASLSRMPKDRDMISQKREQGSSNIKVSSSPAAAPIEPLISRTMPVLTVQHDLSCSQPDPVDAIDTDAGSKGVVVSADVRETIIPPAPSVVNPASADGSASHRDSSTIQVAGSTVAEKPGDSFDAGVTVATASDLPCILDVSPLEMAESSMEWSELSEPETALTDLASVPVSDEGSSVRQASSWRKVASTVTSPAEVENRTVVVNEAAMNLLPTSNETKPADDHSALNGICLVTLIDERKITPSLPEFSAEFQSQRYCFVSKEACEKFRHDPLRYVPAAGGLDVVSVRDSKMVEQGSVDFAVWHRRQLYLFTCAEHADTFRRDPRRYVNAE